MSDEQRTEESALQDNSASDNQTIVGNKQQNRRPRSAHTRVVPVKSIGEQVHKNVQQYHKQLELLNQLKQVKLLKTWRRNGRPTSTYRKPVSSDKNDDIELSNAELMLYGKSQPYIFISLFEVTYTYIFQERIKAMDVTEYRYNPKMASNKRKV